MAVICRFPVVARCCNELGMSSYGVIVKESAWSFPMLLQGGNALIERSGTTDLIRVGVTWVLRLAGIDVGRRHVGAR
jgi:hypothetical protein